MQEEENVKRLFQNWVRSIIFLAKMIHLIQEAKVTHSDFMPLIIRNDLRSGVTQTIRGYNKITTLANTVGHALDGQNQIPSQIFLKCNSRSKCRSFANQTINLSVHDGQRLGISPRVKPLTL